MDGSPPGSSVHGILQEYWSGLPCPPLRGFPYPGVKPASLKSRHWQAGSLPLVPLGKPQTYYVYKLDIIVYLTKKKFFFKNPLMDNNTVQ